MLTKVSVTVFAGGIAIQEIFGIDKLFGVDFFWIAAISLVLITGLYTVIGGMKAVLWTSALQTSVLLLGSFIILFVGLTKFGASRSIVREAIKVLNAKGLLSAKPRRGTSVRPERDWNLLDPDVDFDLSMLEASDNPFFYNMSPMIETALNFSIRFTNRELRQRVASVAEHAAILDAILSRDADKAAEETRGMLERALALMVTHQPA